MYNTKAFLSIRFLLVCRQGNHLTWNLAFRRHSVNVWRRKWQPSPVLLPGKSHGRRSLVSYSPWGREESDRTERLHFHFSLSCIGEGNGNPLQCPCLENPRDKGAWWAAVYGVTRSWTWLKLLSSSSSSSNECLMDPWRRSGQECYYLENFPINFYIHLICFPSGSDGRASACNVGVPGSIPGSGRSPGEGNGNPLQYSCLDNSMDRGAW